MASKSAKTTKKPTKSTASQARRLKSREYKTLRLSKKIKHESNHKIPGSFKLFFRSLGILRRNWKPFLFITLIYGLLSIILVGGIGGGINLGEIKDSIKEGVGGNVSQLATSTLLFGYLVGSTGSSASAGGEAYQTLLVILISLVVIWALRQVLAGKTITARQAFYNGTYPLVPFVLVLLTIVLQLIPLLIGAWLYSTVTSAGIAVSGLERFVWVLMFFLFGLLSLYMVSSSIFALYIVTLPDMTPLKALRSARALVRYRRWTVMRKFIFLPIILLLAGAIIMIPLIMLATSLAQWAFFGLSMAVIVVAHTYMYSLYRELL